MAARSERQARSISFNTGARRKGRWPRLVNPCPFGHQPALRLAHDLAAMIDFLDPVQRASARLWPDQFLAAVDAMGVMLVVRARLDGEGIAVKAPALVVRAAAPDRLSLAGFHGGLEQEAAEGAERK